MLRNDGLLALRNGLWTALLSPRNGGTVAALTKSGAPVLRATNDRLSADPMEAASYPCAPWFGRLFAGLSFDGRHWPLAQTHAAEPNAALHGHVWMRPWAVAAATSSTATLTCAHAGDVGAFPFAFSAEQTFDLVEQGLRSTLRIRNESEETAPFGLGLHPHFPRTDRTTLQLRARGLWRFRVGGGGEESAIPDALNFARGAPLPAETQDVTFLGFGGVAVIETGGAPVAIESDAPHLHLYAPAGASFFCLEPVTHPPGAFGSETLDPGAAMAVSLRIDA